MDLSGYTPPLTESQRKQIRREFTKKVAQRIKKIRNDKGMAQQKLAEDADLHLTYVAHLEHAKYHPTVFVLWKIAKALNVTLNDLVNF